MNPATQAGHLATSAANADGIGAGPRIINFDILYHRARGSGRYLNGSGRAMPVVDATAFDSDIGGRDVHTPGEIHGVENRAGGGGSNESRFSSQRNPGRHARSGS